MVLVVKTSIDNYRNCRKWCQERAFGYRHLLTGQFDSVEDGISCGNLSLELLFQVAIFFGVDKLGECRDTVMEEPNQVCPNWCIRHDEIFFQGNDGI